MTSPKKNLNLTSPKTNSKINLPQSMVDGEKFIKWDEDSMVGTPVTLKVDKYGFYIHWIDQNSESDVLDLSFLKDTRTGKYAKIPKDPKLRQLVNIGSADTLEAKTVSLVFGTDFVNLSFVNLCCAKKEIAQLWARELMQLICDRVQANASSLSFLLKAHTKLTLLPDRQGNLPVKNLVKLFTQNKEEKKRIERILECNGLSTGKNSVLKSANFSFEDFFSLYKCLTTRSEVEKVFAELSDVTDTDRKLMSTEVFVEFINKTQRDPRLNEILHPYANATRAREMIAEHEPNLCNAQRGWLSFDGFLRYLMSEDNPIVTSSKLELSDDMDQPLAHYFINSSHNTYLTGHQITGKSSVEMYRQCLLAGCRCVELDFWNGRTDEPVIVHGYTFVPEIPARDVIEAIAESAFKTSDYPVILSFENHCNPRQQAKIAQYCREFFGKMLLDAPLESHKLDPGCVLPSPAMLKNKIIIKNKKKHHRHHHRRHHAQKKPVSVSSDLDPAAVNSGSPSTLSTGELKHITAVRQGSKDSSQENEEEEVEEDDESSDDDEEESAEAEEIKLQMQGKPNADKVSTRKETEAGAEISALVNYVQPVHFVSFEAAEKKRRWYEMSSFDEKQATALLKERPIEFVNYNKNQLSRVYPGGFRFDSSNFMPQLFWNTGCQLVAINYQTLDLAMQLNLGVFEYNGRSGYLLKPEFLRRRDRRFDPFAESTVDGIIAGSVSINVISGQFLSDKRVGVYVEVEMYGLPADTVRKKFRTKIVQNNGINPVFEDEPFLFKKVVLPDLASIRIAVYDDSSKPIGHRVLPVVGLCPGYRHVSLRNECGQALPLATLFLHVVVKDYVPDKLSDFAEALANPIKFQSELEKRSKQLAVLMDEHEKLDSLETLDSMPPFPPNEDGTIKPKRHPSTGHDIAAPPVDHPSTSTPPSVPQGDATNNVKPVNLPPDTSSKLPCGSPSLNDDLEAESFEKLMENKVVREKKAELERKLDALKRKFDKDKNRLQLQKSLSESDRSKSKLGNLLIKRLSIQRIEKIHITTPEGPDNLESEGGEGAGGRPSRCQVERLIQLEKEYIDQEKELKERYHDMIFGTVEKSMKTSQSNQIKILRALLEKETDAVMKRLQAKRREDVKSLAKKHNKDEMDRIKREIATSMVDKGVNERKRLTQIYERKKEELEKRHHDIRQHFEEERNKAKLAIVQEHNEKLRKLEEGSRTIPESTELDEQHL